MKFIFVVRIATDYGQDVGSQSSILNETKIFFSSVQRRDLLQGTQPHTHCPFGGKVAGT
jgi:hypothetical protein